jgi:hypothetical protein
MDQAEESSAVTSSDPIAAEGAAFLGSRRSRMHGRSVAVPVRVDMQGLTGQKSREAGALDPDPLA